MLSFKNFRIHTWTGVLRKKKVSYYFSSTFWLFLAQSNCYILPVKTNIFIGTYLQKILSSRRGNNSLTFNKIN